MSKCSMNEKTTTGMRLSHLCRIIGALSLQEDMCHGPQVPSYPALMKPQIMVTYIARISAFVHRRLLWKFLSRYYVHFIRTLPIEFRCSLTARWATALPMKTRLCS